MPKPIFVHLSNGTKLSTVKVGKVFVNTDLVLQHVLLIPSFKYNLLSVKRVITDDIAVIFDKSSCLIQDQKIKKILRNLYFLKQDCTQLSHCNFVSDAKSSKYVVWHRRLGHAPLNVLKHTSISIRDDFDSCNTCHKAKQQRLSFTSSSSRATSVFDLVHVDLWGPYKHRSMNNESYFLTIVDDYTRATWTLLLTDKTQVFPKITVFFNMVQTQFGTKIKVIRSDNGTEFVNRRMTEFLNSRGVLHQRSCAYTPQQNGIVERKHKHLLQVARALMFQSGLPIKF